jgi:hypothetical protein
MLGKPRPLQRISTPLAAEADFMTPDTTRINVGEDFLAVKTEKGGVVWNEVKGDSLARVIANTLHNVDYANGAETTGILRSRIQGKFKLLSDIRRHLKKLKGKPKRKRNGLNGMRFIFFVDAGGQPQFQEILPNFLKCDINILVHNLSQTLDHCPHFNYTIAGKKFSVPEKMRLSNLTIIEQSVRSITSSIVSADVDRKPHVVILGTFKDQCVPDSEREPFEFDKMLREKSKIINEKIQPYIGYSVGKCSLYTGHRGKDQVIVAVDGSEEGWNKNHVALEKLKTFINQQVEKRHFEIPIKYFVFLQLLKEAAKKGKPYITLSECNPFAVSSSMSAQEVKKALRLFNDLNIVLYFPGVLETIAFLKPDYLFNMVTNLIVFSFQSESDSMMAGCKHFQDTGIFTADLLRQISFESGEFTEQLFLKLLMGLFVIAEIDPQVYFMPCVLPLENLSEEATQYREIMASNGIDGPFILSFASKMSPRGLLCALLVALGRRPEWNLPQLERRCRNLVNFDLFRKADCGSHRIGDVTIVDRNSCLEVYTTCEGSECPIIRQTVFDALEEACLSLNYNPKHLVAFGFPCPCGAGEPHSSEAFPDRNMWKEKCTINRHKRFPLSKERAAWFGSDSNVGKCA